VKCSDYKKFSGIRLSPDHKTFTNHEVIGPVLGSNVSSMRNIGGRQAQSEWIFFCDHDCLVDEEKILSFLKNKKQKLNNVGAVGGVYRSHAKNKLQASYHQIQRRWIVAGLVDQDKKKSALPSTNHIYGGAMLVRRSVFTKLKGFDESIGWGGEDTDFIKRVQSLGYQTVISFKIKVDHFNNKLNVGGFLKRAWKQNFNKRAFSIVFDNKPLFGKNIYLSVPKTSFPYFALFFVVGSLAHLAGSFTRACEQRLTRFRIS